MNCNFVARGESNDEILRQASEHAKKAHDLAVTPDLAKRVESLIHDENSDAHQRSMSQT